MSDEGKKPTPAQQALLEELRKWLLEKNASGEKSQQPSSPKKTG